MFNYPYPRASLFSRWAGLAKGFNFSAFLDGTQKTLGVINQAIPVVKQVGPMFNNMKSILKVASLFNDATTPRNNNNNNNSSNNKVNNETSGERNENTITNNSYSNSPNFFI